MTLIHPRYKMEYEKLRAFQLDLTALCQEHGVRLDLRPRNRITPLVGKVEYKIDPLSQFLYSQRVED